MNRRTPFFCFLVLAASWCAPISVRAATLTLHPAEKHQVVEGFGTCLVSWKPAVLTYYDRPDFPDFYLKQLGASVLRIDLWTDSAPKPQERWQDITWRDFSFDGKGARGKFFADIAQRLHAASKGQLRVIATVWSPPGWMKVNGSLANGHPDRKNYGLNFRTPGELGQWSGPLDGPEGEDRWQYLGRNKLRSDRYLHFAKLLVEWTRYYRTLGIDLYALSAQNELTFSHYFESCVYTPEEYAELMRVIVWMFAHEGEKRPQLFGPEHMTFDIEKNRLFLEALATRPTALASLDAIASHGYIDGYMADKRPDSVSAFRKMAEPYGKKIWMTEGSTGGHTWPAPLHEVGTSFLNALTEGGVSLLTPWVVVDEVANVHGLTAITGHTKKTSVAMHYFRFLRPGMVRVGVSSDSREVGSVACLDPGSGHLVLVLLNRTKDAAPISLRLTDSAPLTVTEAYLTDVTRDCEKMDPWNGHSEVTVPSESIATLILTPRP
ncbi:MAG: glycoside hydrolase family 30 beta sandwich domain-containing protein [Opitutaceae bacterium]